MPKLRSNKHPQKRLPLRIAHEAFKKLHMGNPISDQELEALFDSFYLDAEKNEKETNNVKSENLWENKYSYSQIILPDIEQELLKYFSKNPEKLYSIHPRKFEEFVAAVFKNNGFTVELTPETRDGGFDIMAIERNNLIGESIYLIECKRYDPSNKVGIGIVQRMFGVVESFKANKGIIATTSSFSKDACDFAANTKYKLALSDYTSITSWLRNLTF